MGELVHIGFGNLVNTDKVVAVVNAEGAPIKRVIQNAREKGNIIDATQGRKTKSVIFTQGEYIILAALQPDTLLKRFPSERDGSPKGGEDE